MKDNHSLSEEGRYLLSLIRDNTGKIEELHRISGKQEKSIKDIQEEYPLLPPEADDLSKEVQRKGAWVMGGKMSPAYRDPVIRRSVFRDIYGEIKRQYGLIDDMGRQKSYKKLKRKYFKGAMDIVEAYELPFHLKNKIESLNEMRDE